MKCGSFSLCICFYTLFAKFVLQIHSNFCWDLWQMDWIGIELTYRPRWCGPCTCFFCKRLSCVGFHYLYANAIEIDSVLWRVLHSVYCSALFSQRNWHDGNILFSSIASNTGHGKYCNCWKGDVSPAFHSFRRNVHAPHSPTECRSTQSDISISIILRSLFVCCSVNYILLNSPDPYPWTMHTYVSQCSASHENSQENGKCELCRSEWTNVEIWKSTRILVGIKCYGHCHKCPRCGRCKNMHLIQFDIECAQYPLHGRVWMEWTIYGVCCTVCADAQRPHIVVHHMHRNLVLRVQLSNKWVMCIYTMHMETNHLTE